MRQLAEMESYWWRNKISCFITVQPPSSSITSFLSLAIMNGHTDGQRNGACKACKLASILIDISLGNSLFSFFRSRFSFVIWLLLLFLLFYFFIFLILIIRFINKENKYYTCYIGCSHSSQF